MERPGFAAPIALLSALLYLPVEVFADTIIYNNPAIAPNQGWPSGALGLNFNVNSPVTVTYLGAYDGGNAANLAGVHATDLNPIIGVTVGIFDRTTGTLVADTSVTLTPNNFTTLPGDSGDAYLPVTPFVLPVGQYSIVAFNDINYNTNGNPNYLTILSSAGGRISFVDQPNYNDYSPLPGTFQFPADHPGPDPYTPIGPADRYMAGTFAIANVPVPGALVLLSTGLLSFGGLAWMMKKRKVAVV